MLDADAIAAHVLGGIAPDALERTGFQNVLSSKYSMLGWSLSGQFTAGKARAKLVSATDGEALVRVTMGEPGDLAHSYMRLKVGASGKIEDWYDYALAMSMSEQLRFSAASEIPFTTLVAMLFGRSDDAATVAKFKSFAAHVIQGNPAAAYKTLQSMPDEVKAARAYATLSVVLSRQLGMDTYRETLNALVKAHGEDKELQFILIDHYFMAEQYEKMLAAIAAAEQELGADEVMSTQRCAALIGMQSYQDALVACDRALAIDPTFDTALWTRVRLGLTSKDAQLVVASLERVEEATGNPIDYDKLSQREAYAWVREQEPFKKKLRATLNSAQ